METAFFIGVFKSQSKRLEAECKRRGVRCRQVMADVGKQGTLGLLPTPSDAIHAFQDWLRNEDENYGQLHIILLPYCEITEALYDELLAAVDLGAHLLEPEAGKDGWPAQVGRNKKYETIFLNDFFGKTAELLPQSSVNEDDISVGEHYRRIEADIYRVRVEPHVYQFCDNVPNFRKAFLKDALDALVVLINEPAGCRHEVFFENRGIHHAQSGGITTHLTITGGKSDFKQSSNVHLKKGDNTSSAAAVRVYYQIIQYNEIDYLLILYAGPHPDKDVYWALNLSTEC